MSSIVTKNQKPVPLIRLPLLLSGPLGTHRSAGQIVQRVLAKANKTSTVLLCLTRAFLNLFLRKNPIPAQQIAYIYG